MQQLRSWLAVAAFSLAAATASPARSEYLVSETDLLAALSADPVTRAVATAPLTQARAELLSAGLPEPPVLAVSREDADIDGVEWIFSLRFKPPPPGRRGLLRDRAGAALHAAEHTADRTRLDFRRSLRQRFAAWALAHARSEPAATYASALESLARFAALRAQAGEMPGITARRLELAAHRARSAFDRTAAVETEARGQVLSWVGALPDGAVPALPPLPPVPPDLDMERELAAHPEVRAGEFEEEGERLARELARRSFDTPEIELGWKQVRVEDMTLEGPVLGLSWPVPAPRRRHARAAQAEAAHESGRARRERRHKELKADLAAHLASFARLRAAAQSAPGDDAALREAVTLSYRLGETDLTTLLETLVALRDTVFEQLDLHADALEAHRALELTAGRPLELLP